MEDCDKIGIPEEIVNKNQNKSDIQSLQELAWNNGAEFLDHIYPYQFVQNEGHFCEGNDAKCYVFLRHSPVLVGTAIGQIKVALDIHGFYFTSAGFFRVQSFGEFKSRPLDGRINEKNGKLEITWSEPPGQHDIVVSYEYNCEIQG